MINLLSIITIITIIYMFSIYIYMSPHKYYVNYPHNFTFYACYCYTITHSQETDWNDVRNPVNMVL